MEADPEPKSYVGEDAMQILENLSFARNSQKPPADEDPVAAVIATWPLRPLTCQEPNDEHDLNTLE